MTDSYEKALAVIDYLQGIGLDKGTYARSHLACGKFKVKEGVNFAV